MSGIRHHIKNGEKAVFGKEKYLFSDDVFVDPGGSVVFENSSVEFDPGKGIICSGVIKAAGSSFKCSRENKHWGCIALAGEGAGKSSFEKCSFSFGGGIREGRLESAYAGVGYDETKDVTPEELSGGAIVLYGIAPGGAGETIRIALCSFFNCSGFDGGAIAAEDSLLSITGCKFHGCEARNDGGSVFVIFCEDIRIEGCCFEGSFAGNDGGAVEAEFCGGVNIDSSVFKNCGAANNGAVTLYHSGNDRLAAVNNCSFENCSAAESGGALGAGSSGVKLSASRFVDCSAGTVGGSCVFDNETPEITGCSFENSRAKISGGAIEMIYIAECADGDDGSDEEPAGGEDENMTEEACQAGGAYIPLFVDGLKFSACSPDDFHENYGAEDSRGDGHGEASYENDVDIPEEPWSGAGIEPHRNKPPAGAGVARLAALIFLLLSSFLTVKYTETALYLEGPALTAAAAVLAAGSFYAAGELADGMARRIPDAAVWCALMFFIMIAGPPPDYRLSTFRLMLMWALIISAYVKFKKNGV